MRYIYELEPCSIAYIYEQMSKCLNTYFLVQFSKEFLGTTVEFIANRYSRKVIISSCLIVMNTSAVLSESIETKLDRKHGLHAAEY